MDVLADTFDFKTITSGASQYTPIPDQIVYKNMDITSNLVPGYRTFDDIDYSQSNCGLNNIILIILESPHNEEFEDPKGPLKNKWGDFCEYFISELQKSIKYSCLDKHTKYSLAFVNAIPFQCSEGKYLKDNQDIKNNNLMNCWNSGFKDDLIKRIQYIAPVLIINLCTYPMKENINDELGKIDLNYTYGDHPSAWSRLKDKNPTKQLIR